MSIRRSLRGFETDRVFILAFSFVKFNHYSVHARPLTLRLLLQADLRFAPV